MMKTTEALRNNEAKILALWTEQVLDTYISSDFFKKSLDRFANPVGGNIREGLAKLFQLLTEDAESQDFAEPLDQIIRIRAVQEFTPSQAVGPLLELKTAVRQIFSADENCRDLLAELLPFDCAVERMVLQAFDIYMDCRERLYKARIRELKSGSYILTDASCASALIRDNLRETVAPNGNCPADKA